MRRRKYGTTWNSKRGRINPDAIPNLGLSRRRLHELNIVLDEVTRLIPRITVTLTANLERFADAMRRTRASIRSFELRRDAITATSRETHHLDHPNRTSP